MISRVFLSVTGTDFTEKFGGTFRSLAEVESAISANKHALNQGDTVYLTATWFDQCNFEIPPSMLSIIAASKITLAISTDQEDASPLKTEP